MRQKNLPINTQNNGHIIVLCHGSIHKSWNQMVLLVLNHYTVCTGDSDIEKQILTSGHE